jgi:hypothetical protein
MCLLRAQASLVPESVGFIMAVCALRTECQEGGAGYKERVREKCGEILREYLGPKAPSRIDVSNQSEGLLLDKVRVMHLTPECSRTYRTSLM